MALAPFKRFRVLNRTAKHKNDCKIVDFSYNNINVQNIKDAFEYFSDVVVSDFDPFGDKKVLDVLLVELSKADTYDKFLMYSWYL